MVHRRGHPKGQQSGGRGSFPRVDAESLPIWIDVFAMSINGLFGAALARSGRMPVAATLVSGLIIGLGGGITRDVLLGLEPTMISDLAYVPAVLAASAVGGKRLGLASRLPRESGGPQHNRPNSKRAPR